MEVLSPKRVLVLAPHCDDAEFGLGITLQKLVKQGVDVRVWIAATGSYRRSDGRLVGSEEREAESAEALASLGVTDVVQARVFNENWGREVGFTSLVSAIEKAIGLYQATELFVCQPSFNQDHQALYEATITACRPGSVCGNLYAYEYPGSCWMPHAVIPAGRLYVTATAQEVRAKITALHMHRSQFEGRRVAVSPRAAKVLAEQRGAEIGREYAELIHVIREIM